MDKKEDSVALTYFNEDFFGALTPYIQDIDVTDINCNARHVWINHVDKGRYKVDIDFKEEDIERLAYKISNTENVQFNVVNPTLKADLHDLRFQFTHKSFSVSGTSVSIRKTPVVARISEMEMERNGVTYLTDKGIALMKACMESRSNTVLCGLTGSGKTELVKFVMKFVKSNERIITIEDTLELHLAKIYDEKDIIEMKVSEHIDYEEAIRICMRKLPVWVLLSESRGKEVKDLLKCISTGAKIVTTLHVDNAKQIPKRILNMFEDNELSNDKIETMIYDYVDIGVHVKSFEENKKTIRYIDQIVYFEIDSHGNNKTTELYTVQKGKDKYYYQYHELPDSLKETFKQRGITIDWEGKK